MYTHFKRPTNLHLQHWVYMKDITWRTLWLWLFAKSMSQIFPFFFSLILLFAFRNSKETRAVFEERTRKGAVRWKTDIFNIGGTSERYGCHESRNIQFCCLYSVCGLFGSLDGFSALCYVCLHWFDWLLLSLPAACILFAFWWRVSRAFRRLRLLSVLIGFLVQFCFPALLADWRHPFSRPFFFLFLSFFFFFNFLLFLIKCYLRFFSCLPCLVIYFYAICFQTFFRSCRFKGEAVVYDGPIAKH